MSDDPEHPPVRITVSRQSPSSDGESYLRSRPLIEPSEYSVFVPVTEAFLDAYTGINVSRFLQTAVALAADNDGRVVLLGIETINDEATLDTVRADLQAESEAGTSDRIETIEKRQRQLSEMVSVAQELDSDVPVSGGIRVVTDATDGILAVLDEGLETAVLLPRGAGLEDGGLLGRSTIDTILADAECDVFVENMGIKEGDSSLYVPAVEDHTVASLAESEAKVIDSILLPVGTGPHSALATEAARAVALAADASVTILHVLSPDAAAEGRSDGEDLLKFADYVLGDDVRTQTELREASDTADEILEEATSHDIVSIGAPEKTHRLEKLVFGSVQQALSETSEATILMSRDPDRTSRSLYYRWKRGIEAMSDESESGN